MAQSIASNNLKKLAGSPFFLFVCQHGFFQFFGYNSNGIIMHFLPMYFKWVILWNFILSPSIFCPKKGFVLKNQKKIEKTHI